MKGVVYDPPSPGLPHVAVILHDNEVIVARTVNSVASGEALIAKTSQSFADAKNAGQI